MPALTVAVQDPDVVRHTLVPSPYTDADAREFLDLAARAWSAGQGAHFAIVPTDAVALLGGVSVHAVERDPAVGQFGYWVAREVRGCGTGRRALARVSAWAERQWGFARLQLYVDVDNPASQRVAEAAGFTKEGLLRSWRARRDGRSDVYAYARLPGAGPLRA